MFTYHTLLLHVGTVKVRYITVLHWYFNCTYLFCTHVAYLSFLLAYLLTSMLWCSWLKSSVALACIDARCTRWRKEFIVLLELSSTLHASVRFLGFKTQVSLSLVVICLKVVGLCAAVIWKIFVVKKF